MSAAVIIISFNVLTIRSTKESSSKFSRSFILDFTVIEQRTALKLSPAMFDHLHSGLNDLRLSQRVFDEKFATILQLIFQFQIILEY